MYFEVEFKGRVSKRSIGDLYIIKARDYVQQLAVTSLTALVGCFMTKYWERKIVTCSGGGGCVGGRGRFRSVDIYVCKDNEEIAVFEVDCKCRSLPSAHTYCIEHFAAAPGLRFVLLLKIFLRGGDYKRIAVVAVLYLRGASGPAVADAVSFGTRSLEDSDAVPDEVARVLRSLPPAQSGPPGKQRMPWTPAQQPHITVPAAYIFGEDGGGLPSAWRPLAPAPAPESTQRESAEPADFVVDLWPILENIDTHAPGDACGD